MSNATSKANRQIRLHMLLTVLWAVMIIPTVLFFKDSVLWVSCISIYALVVGHWSAWEAAKAGVQEVTLRQIRAVTDALAAFMISYQADQPHDDLQSAIDELQAALKEE